MSKKIESVKDISDDYFSRICDRMITEGVENGWNISLDMLACAVHLLHVNGVNVKFEDLYAAHHELNIMRELEGDERWRLMDEPS